MTTTQANAKIKGLQHQAQFTGDKVEAIQLGNDVYIYVNGDKVEELEITEN